jgi:hypothetical protein
MKKLIPLLLLAVIFTVGCDMSGPITISTSGGQPSIVSFNASPTSISAGGSAQLSWSTSGATKVSIDQGIGDVALSGTRGVTPVATTVYTLTAYNASGMSATATTQVMVTGATLPPTPTPTPTPTPDSLPQIVYFTATPPVISYGGSITLSYSVLNATSVSIDNGVGPVSPSSGTAIVSPMMSTNYTLTATNSVGMYYMTISVFVTGAPAVGIPDLVITEISDTGGIVSYKIKNQGDAPAGPSTSTLYVDGVVRANDNVGSIAPGETKTESFTGYSYTCSGTSNSMQVQADTGNAVAEASEVNNSYSKTRTCIIAIIPHVFVVIGPDLVITTGSPSATPSTVAAGGHVTLSAWTVKNQGTVSSGGFSSGFYLSTDSVITASDTYLTGNSNSSGLAAGAQFNWGGPTLTIPAATPPGNYYIGILVDRANAVSESDENNNYVSRLIHVY